jgi:hypothetical protein
MGIIHRDLKPEKHFFRSEFVASSGEVGLTLSMREAADRIVGVECATNKLL